MRKGRFAPSPTGRMHLGNVYAAYWSWRSAKESGGDWLLRIEDLDPQRSRREWAELIEDDLRWLGLDWDEGGLEGKGDTGPYVQSERGAIYEEHFERLRAMGLVYPCRCRRADLLAASAPHQSDGRVVYSGRCRPGNGDEPASAEGCAWRLMVPDREIRFVDRYCGEQRVNLARDCGDFVVRRSDGVWAYQLAVVVDDALMGVTEVIRGRDLLLSAAQQIYLYELLGYEAPEFGHLPLLTNERGERLSKRDKSLGMDELRRRYSPAEVLAFLDK